jgi:two-component system, cell cycle response regulator DivK
MSSIKHLPKRFTVLHLEDDPVSATCLQAAFRRELPEVRVIHARTIEEAQSLVAEYHVNLYILDLTLPDGSGLDFMADIQTLDPEACVVLASAVDSQRLEQARLQKGTQTFMSKPLDLRTMTALVRGHLNEQTKSEDGGTASVTIGFTGQLKDMDAFDVIQFRAVTRITSMLEFSTPNFQAGRIYLEDGNITHAETGKLTGMDALVEILAWPSGAVREVAEAKPSARSIVGNTEVLLMHAAQELDERRAQAAG